MRIRAVLLSSGLLACVATAAQAQVPADSIKPPAGTPLFQDDSLLAPVQLPSEGAGPIPAAQPQPAAPAEPAGPLRDTVVTVDRVVAVVGNQPILASQVDEEIFSRQSQGLQIPKDEKAMNALRKQVTQSIVDEEVLIQEAQRDTSIKVTDQEIADGVEQQIKKIRSNFSSELEYAAELKKAGFQTPDEYRRWLNDQQRRAAYQNRLIDKLRSDGKLKPVIPTEKEMRAYFESQKANLDKRPATISFRQIVVAPKPSVEARQRAYRLADSIAVELRKGADFAVAAKRFSMDSGSRELGGSLNWFRRGTMVPEFERVAFALKPGTISDPVETPFGFHVIQVQRVQPGEVQARHILIMPEITIAETDSARNLAANIAEAARKGASFDSLQQLYHDKAEEREAKEVPITKLPPTYAEAIGEAPAGTVVPPFLLEAATGRIKYDVLLVTERRAAGEVRFEDVRDKVRDQLGEQLAIRRYLDRLKQQTYVELRI
ncbi:MAG TPA: peptidylprolyl isomerase [Gemmatimonadales bacterium]|nr:peptidylprolyl isomerase [Gemmatimonadales bacterium]